VEMAMWAANEIAIDHVQFGGGPKGALLVRDVPFILSAYAFTIYSLSVMTYAVSLSSAGKGPHQFEISNIGHDIVYNIRYNKQYQTLHCKRYWYTVSYTSNQLIIFPDIVLCLYHALDLPEWPLEVIFVVESVVPKKLEVELSNTR
jgi:hypothetical protein